MKKALRVLLLVFCIAVLLAPQVSALVPYATYTYDIDGNYVESPHAYVPDRTITSADIGLSQAMNAPTDMVSDDNGNIFIADPTNNRIVILKEDYTLFKTVSHFLNDQGVPDKFDSPKGLFVLKDELYVCDTENNRIVVFKITFDNDGAPSTVAFDRIIGRPESTAFPEGSTYKPIACAVDTAGRIYVVSSTTNLGIISMNAGGDFLGFLGAQKTSPSAWQIFWRMFQTKEQRQSLETLVPTEYNNITIDDSGFIYVTISSLDKDKMESAILSKSADGSFAPVKKLNAKGADVMLRTGFWPPSGEVPQQVAAVSSEANTEVSQITDVALGEAGMWTIVDASRQRFYTYDSQGNLLFIYGDKGSQLGNNTIISSICYQKDRFLVLDRSTNAFTIYKRTAYGEDLVAAIRNVEERNYDQSAYYWQQVLLRNSNFDEAYIGIADSYYRAGDYEKAEEYYAASYEAQGYSKAYSRIRKTWIEKYIILIPIVIVVIAVLISKFFKYAAKFNEKGQQIKEKRTFKEAVLYGFHVIFHPFDGFWDLKHEKRGNIKASVFFIILTIFAFIYYDVGQSFWYDPYNTGISLFGELTGVLIPLALWVVSNWCLTTLFEGEGSFKDIFIATCYSLLPMALMLIPATLLTHVLTLDESAIVTLLVTVGFVWSGFLLFFGVMVTHDYPFSKNILTVLGTLVGMVIIMFLVMLFSGLFTKIVSFVVNIYTELSLRV